MSSHDIKTWLVAYDIREPRRLRRVHRTLRKAGMAAQYSAFTVEADDPGVKALLNVIEDLIDSGADDVRAYHIPERCPVWRLGKQQWPEEVILTPARAVRLLLDTVPSDVAADAESPTEEA